MELSLSGPLTSQANLRWKPLISMYPKKGHFLTTVGKQNVLDGGRQAYM